MIRVLLADDHPVVRSGYRRLLEQAGGIVVVGEAGDALAAHRDFLDHAPDVLITDLTMPGGGGLALLHAVLADAPHARVLVFSMHDSALLLQRALQAGARGFVTKHSAPQALIDAVHALHDGRRHLSPDLHAALLQHDPEAARLASLSAREHEVFVLLAQGRSVPQCARALGLSAKTVSNHQTLIKDKLGAPTSAALAHIALRHGLLANPGP